jgi:site-specific recombinase XerD
MLINDAIRDYLNAGRARGFAAATLDHYEFRLEKLAKFLGKRHIDTASDVKAEDLDAYVSHLGRCAMKFSSMCSFLRTTRAFFTWLQACGKVLRNPALKLVMAREGDVPLPGRPLTENEVSVILERMPCRNVVDLRNRLQIELLYSCGMRLSETLNLKVADLDLLQRSVRINGKRGKVRILPLMKGTLQALKSYLELRRLLLRGTDDGRLLVGKTTGKPLSELAIYPVLRRLKKTLRLKRHLHPHLFRHSVAVHLLQRGADIRHVQEFLGHASIDTTKIYLRMVPGRLKEDYDRAMPEIAVQA